MKCYSYIRFSSKVQAYGRSYERQLESAREFATEKGWELDESLCMYDLGLSGFHALHKSKGELGIFLKTVEMGKIPVPSALIVENLDRLSREAIPDALTQFLNIIRAGITIVTLMDNQIYDYESLSKDTSQLLISISVMARGYEESRTKQIRRSDAWDKAKQNARNGQKMNARCVAWLKLNKKTGEFEKDDKRVETVQRIYSLYLAGHGLYSICKILNKDKVPTFQKSTKGWGSSTVRRTLTTKTVIGEIQFTKTSKIEDGQRIMIPDGDPVKDYYPPIIDEDTFYAAQHRLELRKCAFGKIGEMNNLFSGIVKCGYCGATMQYATRGRSKIKYLNCREAKRNSCDVGIMMSFRYQDLEDTFLRLCVRLNLNDIIDDGASEHQLRIKNYESKILTITKKIEESEVKVDNYSEAIGTGTRETVAHFVELINDEKNFQKELLEEKKSFQQTLSTLENLHENTEQSLDNLNSILEKISSQDDDERIEIRRKLQKYILELVERIDVYPYGNAYKELWNNKDHMKPKTAKKICSRNMKTYRSVDIQFRAGGKLGFTHDFETEGLRFFSEKNADGSFTDKTKTKILDSLQSLHKNHFYTDEEREAELKYMDNILNGYMKSQ